MFGSYLHRMILWELVKVSAMSLVALTGLLLMAGILAATQVGKAHIALSAIRSDLGLSLVAGSWLSAPGLR